MECTFGGSGDGGANESRKTGSVIVNRSDIFPREENFFSPWMHKFIVTWQVVGITGFIVSVPYMIAIVFWKKEILL